MAVAVMGALAGALACPLPQQKDSPEQLAVLASVAHRVLVPETEAFRARAQALSQAADALADDPEDAAARQAAQQAWREAFAAAQRLEVMQVGPAAPGDAPGGETLRDELYSWPTVNTCAVDRAIVDQGYAEPGFIVDALVYAYGLDALEYLLFVDADTHTCSAAVGIDGDWGALDPSELARRRAAYAAVVAKEVEQHASTLASRWADEGFADVLAAADSPFSDSRDAINQVFRAMFYLDKQAKDGKLGEPLGLVGDCAAIPCTDGMEAPWSGEAAGAVAANLEGLRLLITGGPDPETDTGFDDLLDQAGHPEVAATLLADIDAAIVVAREVDAPLQQLAVDEPTRVQVLHAAVKRVTDTLKGPFVMILNLEIPADGAGDSD